MDIWQTVENLFQQFGPLALWYGLFVAFGAAACVGGGVLKTKKIQPTGFKWKVFRREIFFSILNLAVSAAVLGAGITYLKDAGFIQVNSAPAAWWVILLEFAFYFFAFDTYFYWLHRLMHVEPVYSWVHKIHHGSISPNPLTTLSVSPLESLINGGFVPLFTAAFTVHESTMLLIAPTNIIMGLYVHSGYEFLPRWWNKTWFTRWFITTTFHDQHHRFYKGNYGGYTTLWDFLCGTVRPHYLADFDRITNRGRAETQARGQVSAPEA